MHPKTPIEGRSQWPMQPDACSMRFPAGPTMEAALLSRKETLSKMVEASRRTYWLVCPYADSPPRRPQGPAAPCQRGHVAPLSGARFLTSASYSGFPALPGKEAGERVGPVCISMLLTRAPTQCPQMVVSARAPPRHGGGSSVFGALACFG